nr:PREDICTED: sodium-coupled neutral amino acid transporter 1 [Latimeria chalumnae]|eukprot:XP_014343337.1 PREDICTED: sodium-coupled neutral amino acid transporter 1 [Latimeria chalumnae]
MDSTELENMNISDEDNVSNDSTDLIDAEESQIHCKSSHRRESENKLEKGYLKKEDYEHTYGNTSFGMSVFNLSNVIMGSGILGLAYALANTGIILFVLLLASMALLALYSIYLLLKCSKETGLMVYEKMGQRAFGTPGRLAVFGATFVQNMGAILSYLIIVRNELPLIISYLLGGESSIAWYLDGRFLIVLVTVFLILPLCCLRNLGYLGYTSGFSLACMVFFLIVVISKKFEYLCPLSAHNESLYNLTDRLSNLTSKEEKCKANYFVYHSKTIYALPTIAFAFVCHPSVLPIYSELKGRSQKKMQLVSNASFFAIFIMYLLTAIFGYLTFYETVETELLHTYKSDSILVLIVRLAVVIAVVLTVPVLFFTVRSSLFELFKKTMPSLALHIGVTIILLVAADIFVILIPSIKDIFGMIGATSANMLIFILPSSMYLKLVKKRNRTRIYVGIFLGLGILFALITVPLVIYDWFKTD